MNESEVQCDINGKDNPDIAIIRHNPKMITLKRLAITLDILNALGININEKFEQVQDEVTK